MKRFCERCNEEMPESTCEPSLCFPREVIKTTPAADVATVRHGRCPVCSGKTVLTQDCDNGYSLEIDAEQQEASVWYEDACLAVFSITYCPNYGIKILYAPMKTLMNVNG